MYFKNSFTKKERWKKFGEKIINTNRIGCILRAIFNIEILKKVHFERENDPKNKWIKWVEKNNINLYVFERLRFHVIACDCSGVLLGLIEEGDKRNIGLFKPA